MKGEEMPTAVQRRKNTKSRAVRKAPRAWPQDGVATVPETAKFLGVDRVTVYRMVKAGRLKPFRNGPNEKVGVIRFAWSWLHNFVEGQPV